MTIPDDPTESLARARRRGFSEAGEDPARALALLRTTFEATSEGILATDAAGRVTDWNARFASLWNVPQDLLAARDHRRLLESMRAQLRDPAPFLASTAALGAAATDGAVVTSDVLELADGRVLERDVRVQRIDGRAAGAVWIFRDATERRRAEEALRRSEADLSDFFESAAIGLHWVGPDGTILRVNQAELDLLGYTREEYVGRNIAEFHCDPDVIADILRRLVAGETLSNHEARMRCKDGTVRDVQIMSSVLREGGRFVHSRCFTRDVTDRNIAVQAQARLAAIVQSSSDAIVSKTLDGTIRSWNAGAEQIFGYTEKEMVGRSIMLLIPTDRAQEEAEIVARLSRGESIDHYETVRIAKGGRRLHISLSVSPIRDASGRVVAASKIARDITSQREAEQARRRSEEQFRQLADALPQIVWSARPDGILQYCNDRWYEFVGASRADPGAQSWVPILHPDDLQRSMDTYDGCIRSGNLFEIEYRFRDRRTGGYRWFLARAFPLRDDEGRIVRWIGTCTDIDDAKEAQEKTRFLADASAELAVLTDYRTTLQKVAGLAVPYFADWCAVDVREADGSIQRVAVTHRDPAKIELAHELFRRHPPLPGDEHGVARALRTGESEWVPYIPDALKAGPVQEEEQARMARELGLASYICTPLRSRRGTLGALTFATAESGRVFDASDVAAAEDLASRAVIAIENANLLATLRESDRRKDEFLAMLAHELRNPLAPIRNSVQIFRAHGTPVPDLQWATEVIDRQVRQMTRLIDDLLDVSRITRGKIELRRRRVELSEVVESAVEASRPVIDKWRHHLAVAIPPQPIVLDADPARLAQVLSNLLNNAAKYMDPGGRIWLTAAQQGDDVVVSVRDTGIGIRREALPRVFDMFMQGEPGSERSEGGLGIGLTLVRRLVELHGGTVEASSEGPGMGSEFRVRIPAAGAAAIVPAIASQDGAARLAGAPARRILVVDDNRDAADTLRLLLRMLGHDVQTAHDGLAAVGATAAFRPEIVLLDLGLPKLTGYDAARRIRAQDGGADVILVALSGWGQEEDRRRALEAGFDFHVTKPVEFDALRKLFTDLETLRASRARQCGA